MLLAWTNPNTAASVVGGAVSLNLNHAFEAAMAGLALIAGIQQRPDLGAVLTEVRAFVDRGGDHRGDVAQLQVLLMAELLEGRRR